MSTSVFLSYSRKDQTAADHIAAELRKRGADVFIDYQRLQAGNFVKQLGNEIDKRESFVLLLSPRSVGSPWVQAEVAWAFMGKKRIVPVLLETTSLVDMFVVASLEQVDFTNWTKNKQDTSSIEKLIRLLGLPDLQALPAPSSTIPIQNQPADTSTDSSPLGHYPDPSIAFNTDELDELFFTALTVETTDPEQAAFLYRRVMESDPEYLQGQMRYFVDRIDIQLQAQRVDTLLSQAETHLNTEQPLRALQLSRDALTIDPSSEKAQQIRAQCEQKLACDAIYQQASTALYKSRIPVAMQLLREVHKTCPDYGNPDGLFRDESIRAENAFLLHPIATFSGAEGTIRGISFSPDDKILAVGSRDNAIRLLDTTTYKEITRLQAHKGSVTSVGFTPDGQYLASGSWDETIKLWNPTTFAEIATLKGHTGVVSSLTLSYDSSLLVSGSNDQTIRIWDVESHRQIALFQSQVGTIYDIDISPDGTLIASGSRHETIKLWDIVNRREVGVLEGHNYAVNGVAFSPDGRFLASACGDSNIILWDIKEQQAITTLAGHRDSVTKVTFSPDSSLLASAAHDRRLKIWDVNARQEIMSKRHSSPVRSVKFSHDGKLLASGDEDGTILLWGLG